MRFEIAILDPELLMWTLNKPNNFKFNPNTSSVHCYAWSGKCMFSHMPSDSIQTCRRKKIGLLNNVHAYVILTVVLNSDRACTKQILEAQSVVTSSSLQKKRSPFIKNNGRWVIHNACSLILL